MTSIICCSVKPHLNKITFEEAQDIPTPGARLMSACGRRGTVREITPAQVIVVWDGMNGVARTYTNVSFGPVI